MSTSLYCTHSLGSACHSQRIGEWMMELKKAGRLEPSVILPVSALKTNTSNRSGLQLGDLPKAILR